MTAGAGVSRNGVRAAAYARAGWPVFPVRPSQPDCPSPASCACKAPLTRHGVDGATTDLAAVERYWCRHPDANVAIATGWPGPVVLDVDVAHGGPPLLDEWDVFCRVHRALPLENPIGEALQDLHEELFHRAEVVVDEPVIRARFFRELARRDVRVTMTDEQAFRRVEERLLGLLARRRDADPFASAPPLLDDCLLRPRA